jgi:CRISPR-associated helicase Cas3/CRISPR-associated endonuclease Cas3-HD
MARSDQYFAHSDNAAQSGKEPLATHLSRVSKLAAEYAAAAGGQELARVTGLLHDLGKYGDLFQQRLRQEVRRVDHSTPGALAALRYKAAGIAPALAIQGHHGGLRVASPEALRSLMESGQAEVSAEGRRLSEPDLGLLLTRLRHDGLELPATDNLSAPDPSPLTAPSVAAMLDVRMLFSALVDADFVATEAHFTGHQRPAGPPLKPEQALSSLRAHLETLPTGSPASPGVLSLRADLLEACLNAADRSPGLFTLTAPTGAGKTLSMLAFALLHAVKHDLRRIVVVIPYLSIIEQTVRVYREALASWCGADSQLYVLEDHSLAGTQAKPDQQAGDDDPEDEAQKLRDMLSENWDAPLVVTTSVQFLESLFAHRPAPCRKLHRLAQSVILFDEVQTIPENLVVPTLAALGRLAERYGSSVVFSTATQPAFRRLDQQVRRFSSCGWEPTEIAPEGLQLFERARRITVRWPQKDTSPLPWEQLAQELAACPQVLCVVNLKRHAAKLLDRLTAVETAGLFHLSTSMCPAHRQNVLARVANRPEGEPCRLISTQCVEAGVDVDFPVVYRAWGPLEALAQAAGRCNRNGNAERGEVRVFFPESEPGRRLYPDVAYGQAADVAQQLFREYGEAGLDLCLPEVFTRYYSRLYQLADPARFDYQRTQDALVRALGARDFAEVARLYQVIKQDAINVLVPYAQAPFPKLVAEARQSGLTREWVQHARPYTVSLFRPRAKETVWSYLEPIRVAYTGEEAEDWFIYLEAEHYDKRRGLKPPQADNVLIA